MLFYGTHHQHRVRITPAGGKNFMKKIVYVYILTNDSATIFHTGITVNLERRIRAHRDYSIGGDAKKFSATRLIYYECHESVSAGLQRYNQIRLGSRKLKVAMIKLRNCAWRDLAEEFSGLAVADDTEIASNGDTPLYSRTKP